MAVTYGFYNALNDDRVYDAIQMSSIFDGVILDGIFSTIGTSMVVTASGDGMYVNVGAGRAWFNHTWTLNDTILPIEAPEAELVLNRIDAVVLEVNSSVETRANTIKFVKGSPSSNPQRPNLIHTAEVNQYALAYIRINAGATEIVQANITNVVGTDETPFVTGILQQISIEQLILQWEAEFNDHFSNWEDTEEAEYELWAAARRAEFDAWFATIQDILDESTAGHLQNEIDEINRRTIWTPAISRIIGDTSVNFTHPMIHTSSIIELFSENTSDTAIGWMSREVTEGHANYVIPELTENTMFKLRITNLQEVNNNG